jgi:hypothetical protein
MRFARTRITFQDVARFGQLRTRNYFLSVLVFTEFFAGGQAIKYLVGDKTDRGSSARTDHTPHLRAAISTRAAFLLRETAFRGVSLAHATRRSYKFARAIGTRLFMPVSACRVKRAKNFIDLRHEPVLYSAPTLTADRPRETARAVFLLA